MFNDYGLLQNHCLEHASAVESAAGDSSVTTHVVSVDESSGQQVVTYIAKEDEGEAGNGAAHVGDQIVLQVNLTTT